ncbi:hypothetical protein [Vibrio cholerae]|uniref:hypothetical protein n=1 Tax=Vibrio cholerae TaxID=666 RepID=UPI00053C3D3C|nr:hypothetical protein [Vibrio cholerae]EGR2442673.1 hypothetical protein [Vibrio cholerae]BCK26022.1 hypothetical protein VCSRO63_2962 [Vibrio cholerae]GHX14485.1 hypothetical protein VCSRO60_3598 [Vibrio cholerae]
MSSPQGISENELKVWYGYANEVIGTLAIGFAAASLQFEEYSAEVATIFWIFSIALYVTVSKKKRIRFHQDRLARYKGKFSVLYGAGVGGIFFLVGMTFLVMVAAGYDLSLVKGFSFKSVVEYLVGYLPN